MHKAEPVVQALFGVDHARAVRPIRIEGVAGRRQRIVFAALLEQAKRKG
jgi:hypothetical protein